MKRKSFLWLFLLLSFTISVLAASAGRISIGNEEAKPGDTVQVTVRIESETTLGAVGLQLSYDSTVLTLTDIQCAPDFSGGYWKGNTDTAKLVWADTKGVSAAGGKDFAFLTFRVAANAAGGTAAKITAEYDPHGDIADLEQNSLQMEITAGSITVKEEETTTAAEETTTAAEETTTAAEETTTAAEETTTAAEETTTAEEETTTAAEETTTAAEETTTAAEETTTAAEETTTAAKETTTAADATTTATKETTTSAEITTTATKETTTAAEATATVADETTTAAASAPEESTTKTPAKGGDPEPPDAGEKNILSVMIVIFALSASAAAGLILGRRKFQLKE